MIQGHCNCGAIQYRVDTDVSDVYVCHCSICRRFTGAGGIAVVVVSKSAFRWVSGQDQIGHWRKPGADWEAWFCSHCGSAVPGDNNPATMFIPAGSFSSGGEQLKVAHHIYVGSKAPWEIIGDDGLQHIEGLQA